ncbi:MAG: 50S ribosomal protein L23 [Candidatus Pacebacteria bacterium]|nr:50S ribosomal protein L23 [Candidatus Paceibacterota bacterium]
MASQKITIKKDGISMESMDILKKPRITEKAAILAEENFYVFEVEKTANKMEIKKAVEEYFKVNVENVNIVNLPRQKVQKGKVMGHKSGCKKAIVKIKKGQKIDIIEK